MADWFYALFTPDWAPLAASFGVLGLGMVMALREKRRRPADEVHYRWDGRYLTCLECPTWYRQPKTVDERVDACYEHSADVHQLNTRPHD